MYSPEVVSSTMGDNLWSLGNDFQFVTRHSEMTSWKQMQESCQWLAVLACLFSDLTSNSVTRRKIIIGITKFIQYSSKQLMIANFNGV